ncbi:hypothetical protein BH23ACT12_BH23ACT12_19400 [soil metagenome]
MRRTNGSQAAACTVSLVDGAEGGGLLDATDIAQLRPLYLGAEFTDLLLLR